MLLVKLVGNWQYKAIRRNFMKTLIITDFPYLITVTVPTTPLLCMRTEVVYFYVEFFLIE